METYARQFLAGMAQLGLILIAARTIGSEQTGSFAIALIFPKLMAAFLNLGLGSANVYFIASRQVQPDVAWASSRNMMAIMSLLGLGIGAAIIPITSEAIFPSIDKLSLSISLIAFPFILIVSTVASIFQALQIFREFNRTILLQPLLAFLAACILWFLEAVSLNALLGLVTLAHVIAGVAALASLMRHMQLLGSTGNSFQYARQAVRYGVKAHISNVLTFLNYRVDLFLVNAIAGPASAGLYAIAVRLAEQLWMISQAFSTVVLPRLSGLNDDEMRRRFITLQMARLAFFSTLFCAATLSVFSEIILYNVFGENYLDASNTLRILLAGVVLLSTYQIISSAAAARGLVNVNIIIASAILFFNILLNLILINYIGIEGAAIATISAFAIGFFIRVYHDFIVYEERWWSVIFPKPDEIAFLKRVLRLAFRVRK